MAAQVASTVLNGVLQGLILTGLVWLALRVIPRLSAATRYGVWLLTLGFVLALPVADRLMPAGAPGELGMPAARAAAPPITLPAGGWTEWVLAAWAVISFLLVARVPWSYAMLQRTKRRASILAAPQFAELVGRCRGRRRPALLVSTEIAMPLAAGLHRPAVLIPEFLAGRLSETELRDVLAHELAHLRRWDDWTNLLQRVIEAVCWFHPAVLWIGRRLRLERELACDDWAVALSGTVRPYAACLTKLAALVPAASAQLAPGAMARKPQVSVRVEALLARTRNGTAKISRAALAAAAAALAVAGVAALPLAPVGVAEPPAPPVPVARGRAAGPPSVPERTVVAQSRPAAPPRRGAGRRSVTRVPDVSRRSVEVAARKDPGRSAAESSGAGPVETAQVAVTDRAVPDQDSVPATPVMEWRAQRAAWYLVWLPDGERGWIQILWLRPAHVTKPVGRT